MKKPHVLILLLLSGLCIASLSACPSRVNAPNVNSQNQSKQTLKLQFSFGDPLPEYVKQTKKIEVSLTPKGSTQLISDSFDFQITSSTQQVSRDLTNLPTGVLSLEIRLLDADGKEVRNSLKSTFQLIEANKDPVQVKLTESPSLLVPLSGSRNLTVLRQQRQTLLVEIQSLSSRESELLKEVLALRTSPNPEDQNLRLQYQAELRGLQNQIEAKETELASIDNQLKTVEAQSVQSGSGVDQERISQLRLQVDKINLEIEQMYSQSRLLAQEARSYAGNDISRFQQIQNEQRVFETQIQDKIRELELVSIELQQLESKITGQNTSGQSAEERKKQLQADLATLEPRLENLDLEIRDLQAKITALLQASELLQIQRREAFEAELKVKQSEQTRVKALIEQLKSQLASLN